MVYISYKIRQLWLQCFMGRCDMYRLQNEWDTIWIIQSCNHSRQCQKQLQDCVFHTISHSCCNQLVTLSPNNNGSESHTCLAMVCMKQAVWVIPMTILTFSLVGNIWMCYKFEQLLLTPALIVSTTAMRDINPKASATVAQPIPSAYAGYVISLYVTLLCCDAEKPTINWKKKQ